MRYNKEFEKKVKEIIKSNQTLKQHVHCKKCGKVIENFDCVKPFSAYYYTVNYFDEVNNYELRVCKECVKRIGIETLKKEKK